MARMSANKKPRMYIRGSERGRSCFAGNLLRHSSFEFRHSNFVRRIYFRSGAIGRYAVQSNVVRRTRGPGGRLETLKEF